MPHDIMNTMHGTGMPVTHHWLFWTVVVVVFAALIFSVWWFGIRGKYFQ